MGAIAEEPVRRQWSTADVEARHALAYWVDTICHSFLEIDIDSPDRDHFHGLLEQSELGPATLYVVEADTQLIRRTPARIARSRYAGYFLLQLRRGQLRFRQYEREVLIEPGDCLLVDCSAPYRLECLPTTRSVALRFPQPWLKNWIPAPERIAARPFRRSAPWSAVLSAALANLDPEMGAPLALPSGVVAEPIAVLLALAAGPDVHAASSSEKLIHRIRSSIRDRSHEPGLTPAAIAAAHGISKRYLHHLFAQVSTTFGSELMRLRLDSAHRLLSDHRYDALTISEVAARCGFAEPSHFARRFRRSFGAGPTEFRTQSRSREGVAGVQ